MVGVHGVTAATEAVDDGVVADDHVAARGLLVVTVGDADVVGVGLVVTEAVVGADTVV